MSIIAEDAGSIVTVDWLSSPEANASLHDLFDVSALADNHVILQVRLLLVNIDISATAGNHVYNATAAIAVSQGMRDGVPGCLLALALSACKSGNA